MWTRTDIAFLAAKSSVRIASASLLSFAAGAAATYFVVSKRTEAKYEEIIAKEIAEAKAFYSQLYKTDDKFSTPQTTIATLHGDVVERDLTAAVNAISQYASDRISSDATMPVYADRPTEEEMNDFDATGVVQTHNIFTDTEPPDDSMLVDPFNAETEQLKKDKDLPYVVTQEDHLLNEDGYEQVSITYYRKDGVLADDQDVEIPDIDGTIGTENLDLFGYGSKSPHLVYIRNDEKQIDFEVTLSTGSYGEDVMGFIKHSEPRFSGRRPPKKSYGHSRRDERDDE